MAALRAETDKVAHIESTIGMLTKCCQVYLIRLFNLKAIKHLYFAIVRSIW